uniref:Uncharacterized protein n=1 Tax=Solanum lycopersicum TaxID=4081 RepID=K4CTD2_SOLLC
MLIFNSPKHFIDYYALPRLWVPRYPPLLHPVHIWAMTVLSSLKTNGTFNQQCPLKYLRLGSSFYFYISFFLTFHPFFCFLGFFQFLSKNG